MKNKFAYILWAAFALLIQSCVGYISEPVHEDPAYRSMWSYYRVQTDPLFRGIEAAHIFRKYKKIQDDREQALTLVKKYYGNRLYELYYEKMSILSVGTIYIEKNGNYNFYSNVTESNRNSMRDFPYIIEYIAPDLYKVKFEAENISSTATMRVNDDKMEVVDFQSTKVYNDDTIVTISSSDNNSMKMSLVDNGYFLSTPESGEMNVSIVNTNILSDQFTVSFGSKIRIIRETEVTEYEPIILY